MTVSDQQSRDIAVDPSKSVAAPAPAGSGKTSVLLLRAMNCLAVSTTPEEVVAITFTNKAANEILERAVEALQSAKSGEEPSEGYERALYQSARKVLARDEELGWGLLKNPSRLRIMTFDSYCAQIARNMPVMSGMGGSEVSDNPTVIYEQAILSLLHELDNPSAPSELREAIEYVLNYSKNQFELLIPLFSSLLSKREQWMGEVMAGSEDGIATFTRVIGREKEEVLSQLGGVFVSFIPIIQAASVHDPVLAWSNEINDIHSLTSKQMRKIGSLLLTAKGDIRKKVTKANGFIAKQPSTDEFNLALKDLAVMCGEDERKLLCRAGAMPNEEMDSDQKEGVNHLYVILRYLLASLRVQFEVAGAVDFSEVALRAINALSSEDVFGDALLLEDRVNHYLIDEMQDTNYTQMWLLDKLCSGWERDDGKSIFFCGDSLQSIYFFRGALVHLFDKLLDKQQFAGKKLEITPLTSNFRSGNKIVEANNSIFSQVCRYFTPSSAEAKKLGEVSVFAVNGGAEEEAIHTVNRIEVSLNKGCDDIAVLVRNRSHLTLLMNELRGRNIPFSGNDTYRLLDVYAVRTLDNLMKALWHRYDKSAWLSVLRSPLVGLNWEDCIAMTAGGRSLYEALTSLDDLNLSEHGRSAAEQLGRSINEVEVSSKGRKLEWRLKAVWERLGASAIFAGDEKDINLYMSFLQKQTTSGTLDDFNKYQQGIARLFANGGDAPIKLMTIHKSKGLEFDHVILHGMSQGSRPAESPLLIWHQCEDDFVIGVKPLLTSSESSTLGYNYIRNKWKNAQSEELDRVLYVAMTRAKNTLEVMCATDTGVNFSGLADRLNHLYPASFIPVVDVVSHNANSREGTPLLTKAEKPVYVDRQSLAPGLCVETQKLGEDVLTSSSVKPKTSDQVVGMVFHQLMHRHTAGMDVATIEDNNLCAALLNQSHPIKSISYGLSKLKEIISNTINTDLGKWIMKDREFSESKYEILETYNNGSKKHVIDRCFEESGALWAVDYITTSPEPDEEVDAFIKRESLSVRGAITGCAKALGMIKGQEKPVKPVLYFPELTIAVCPYSQERIQV